MMSTVAAPPRPRLAPQLHRVLIYSTCYNVLDGVTLTIRKLEQELLSAGHHVCILSTNSGDPGNTHLDGTHPNRRVVFMDNAVPIPFVNDPNNPDHTYQIGFALSPNIKVQLEEFDPSIMHITCPDCTALHLIDYARLKEIPLMGTYHSNIAEYVDHYPGLGWVKCILGSFFRHQYNFLQALYAPTPFIVKHLTDAWHMDAVTNLGIWGRGVDTEKFHPCHGSLKYRHQLGIPDDCVVICWVGRLVTEKSVHIFSNVIRRLHATGVRNFHALVIGAGPCEEDIKTLPNTTFTGWMTADQLTVAYASCDVFLFPSSVETFGNVTLEAAASGLPVVVEAGCSGHLVKNGVNGFGCPEGDENAFFQATRELVMNEKLRKSCSKASRLMAEGLEKRTVVRGMIDHYNRVTDEFYTEYGGHHANRDALYRKPGSFVCGGYPRPLLLAGAEFLFFVLFQMIWNMTSIYMSMQRSMTRPVVSSSSRVHYPAEATKRSSNNLSKRNSNKDAPDNLAGCPTIVELDDVDLEEGSQTDSLLRHTPSQEEETESCSSSSQDSSEAARSVSTSCATPVLHCAGRGCDGLSKIISLALVRTVECQCRMESRVRDAVGACCKPSHLPTIRKRKNSWDQKSREPLSSKTRSSPDRPVVLRRQHMLDGS